MKLIEMCESYRHLEIRKLPYGSLNKIIDILEIDHDWKKLMSKIPKYPQNSNFESKYNNEHIRIIENESQLSGRKCTAILFEEWGTSGRVRPTLTTLKDLLIKCEMYRAADEVALLLREAPPQRPANGPAAPIDTDVSLLLNNESIEQKLNAMDSIKSNITANSYNQFNNKTTAQLKSISDFIQFSHTAQNATNVSIFTPDKKTPVEGSDLIKFSRTNYLDTTDLPNVSALNPNRLLESDTNVDTMDIPNLTALMKISNNFSNTGSGTQSTISELSENSDLSTQSQSRKDIQLSNNYQVTFPNIDLSVTVEDTDDEIFQNSNLINFKYEHLQHLTNNFSVEVTKGPNSITGKIGMGGFGDVFVTVHPKLGAIAIKKAHSEMLSHKKRLFKLFNAEVKYLSQFQHENIVPILGYSRDGPAPCIICEYIDGGSLEQKIEAKVLSEKQRIDIMIGTAEGLKYLHKSDTYDNPTSETQSTTKRTNFVHGDVKSANILLTRDCVPKLCDFGLAKQYNHTFVTTSPFGTSAYMAPEGLSGTITQKVDIYSFGIVLLELLTGLKSIVYDTNEQINIKDYVEEYCENNDISGLLDSVVDKWIKANEIYELAKECLERNRKKRLAIEDVSERLNKIRI